RNHIGVFMRVVIAPDTPLYEITTIEVIAGRDGSYGAFTLGFVLKFVRGKPWVGGESIAGIVCAFRAIVIKPRFQIAHIDTGGQKGNIVIGVTGSVRQI